MLGSLEDGSKVYQLCVWGFRCNFFVDLIKCLHSCWINDPQYILSTVVNSEENWIQENSFLLRIALLTVKKHAFEKRFCVI